jgi:hypothetical protein
MAMKESGNRRHKWLATRLMLTLMAGISSIALAQEERSGAPAKYGWGPLKRSESSTHFTDCRNLDL